MRKLTGVLICAGALLLAVAISYRSAGAQAASYAEDRALIEDLQARYLFALDFGDVDKYLATFTPDGVLDIGDGEIRGHDAIRKIIGQMPKGGTGRHNITNIVIKVNGNKALGRAYWFHYSNNPQRKASLDGYGHYEDEMIKVKGQWLFTKRRIYNEGVERWASKPGSDPVTW